MNPGIRERLIGAFVLVAVVVLLVPAIMQGPGRTAGGQPVPATRSVEVVLDAAGPASSDRLVPEPKAAPPAPLPVVTGEAGNSGAPAAIPATVVEQAAASPQTGAPAGQAAGQSAAWAVQLGAFSSRDKAERLVADLRSRGYSAFVLEYRADGQLLHRVRVGPEQDRERAVAIAERLKKEKDGFRPVVAPHP